MKRSLIAVSFAVFAATAFAGNSQYNNEAGEQDLHSPIADAGDKGAQDQNYPQVG
jgi:hypothetical protein